MAQNEHRISLPSRKDSGYGGERRELQNETGKIGNGGSRVNEQKKAAGAVQDMVKRGLVFCNAGLDHCRIRNRSPLCNYLEQYTQCDQPIMNDQGARCEDTNKVRSWLHA